MSSIVVKRYGDIIVEWNKGGINSKGNFTVTVPYHLGGPDTKRTYSEESDAISYAKRKYKEKIKEMNISFQKYGTGGNCEALFCELDGIAVLVTDFSGVKIPEEGESYLVGFYKSDDVCGQELVKFESADFSYSNAIELIKKNIGSAVNSL